MRKHDVVKEYVRGLCDDDIRFLQTRLSQRLGGDMVDALELIQQCPEVDKWLAGASSHAEFFARLDHIEALVQGEAKKRISAYEPKEKSSRQSA